MSDHVSSLAAAIARWNAGDLDGYLRLYDPTIRLYGYGPEALDRDAVGHFYRDIWSGLTADGAPAPALEIHQTLRDGEHVTARFTMSGVHTGTFMGVPASGRPYRMDGITILRFGASGGVVERWSCADFLTLLTQVGAVAAPA